MVREKQKRSEAHMKMDGSSPPKTRRLALKGTALSHLAGTSISRSSKNFKGSMTKAFCGSQKTTYLALKRPSVFWWHTSFQRKAIDGLWEETGWEVRETGFGDCPTSTPCVLGWVISFLSPPRYHSWRREQRSSWNTWMILTISEILQFYE